jgi:hypothetical protein
MFACHVLYIAHEHSHQCGTFNMSIIQSIMANTVEITPHFTDNPRAQLESWLESVASAARKFCAEHSQWGALSLACTETHWQALHGDPAPAAPRQVFADPGPLDPLANPAVRQQHKDDKRPCTRVRYSRVTSDERTLLSAWLKQGRDRLML